MSFMALMPVLKHVKLQIQLDYLLILKGGGVASHPTGWLIESTFVACKYYCARGLAVLSLSPL